MFDKPFTLDRTVRTVGIILTFIVSILLVNRLSGVLFPFFAAWLIAYMLNPMVNFFQHKLKFTSRVLSVMTVIILILGIVTFLITLAAASIKEEYLVINKLIEAYAIKLRQPSTPSDFQLLLQENINPDVIKEFFSFERILNTIKDIIPNAMTLLTTSFSYISNFVVFFIMLLYIFFILMEFEEFSDDWQDMVPKKYHNFAKKLFGDLAYGMNNYFRKQALISLIVGCLFSIAFSIIGLPLAIGMGMLIGLLNMIPYMHSLGIIPPIFIALIQSAQTGDSFWMMVLWIVVSFAIIQVILDAVLTPRIMGNATGLKPAIILLSLSIGGSLMGVIGMTIALPIATLVITYYKTYLIHNTPITAAVETLTEKQAKEAKPTNNK